MRAVAKNMTAAADLILEELQQQTKQHDVEEKCCCEGNNMETPLVSLPPLPCGYSHSDVDRTVREASTMVCIYIYIYIYYTTCILFLKTQWLID